MACDPKAISGGLDLSASCLELDVDWSAILSLSIALPGGSALSANIEPGEFPDLGKVVNDMLAKLNTALTPLIPFFRLLDVVLALVDCVKAIPDSLGPPPNPMPLIKCLQKLLKALGYVLQLIPQLSIPLLIQSICNLLVSALTVVRDQLACMLMFSARLSGALLRAESLAAQGFIGATRMIDVITCSRTNLDSQLEGISVSVDLLATLIKLVNVFAGLIGLPEIPSPFLPVDGSASLTIEILDPINDGIEALKAICAAIPLP